MTGTPARPPAEELPGDQATPGEDRVAPDYEGREAEGLTAGEFLIWIPRVIFYPVHLVLEWVVRWPLVQFITVLEKYHLLKRIEQILTWRDGKSGVYPTFFGDFGLKPSIGITTFHRDFPATGNDFNLNVAWWGPRWINAHLRNSTTVLSDDGGKFDVFGTFVSRPDYPFYGIGSNTQGANDDRYRYQERRIEGGLLFAASLGGLHRIRASSTFRDVAFGDNPEGPDSPLTKDTRIPGRLMMEPIPGFNDPDTAGDDGLGHYQLIDSRLEIKIDTRDPDTEFKGGTGFLLELFGSFSFDPSEPSRNFVRWGAETGVFVDLTKRGHVIALRVYGEFVEETGGSVVPFTELASLGGNETMRGYLPRRFLGDSSFETTLSYRYPVWSLLNAELFLSAGNTYEGHWGLNDGIANNRIDFDNLFLSGGFGLRTSIARDTALQILVAVGTNRLDSTDIEIDSFRFVFGLVEGF
jgi:hypothetical protein